MAVADKFKEVLIPLNRVICIESLYTLLIIVVGQVLIPLNRVICIE